MEKIIEKIERSSWTRVLFTLAFIFILPYLAGAQDLGADVDFESGITSTTEKIRKAATLIFGLAFVIFLIINVIRILSNRKESPEIAQAAFLQIVFVGILYVLGWAFFKYIVN